ncbi:MAG TPA: flavodoxin-dependent (E)-4-hydroxy-3-methylbut-2-enyl-diphosphate synthase [Firmicutes bacterium]|nr:flavodoxin-dependent (E)-4-hydroxy-3-methylbut-2-enyl-diphosphate synthase [Candidatus Fermentithermobacillaceae bacterium]
MNAVDMLFKRRETTPVRCGEVIIGGESPVSIQTMTTTDTRDVQKTTAEIQEAVEAGADIVRVAVPDKEAAEAIASIKRQVKCPIVADIHYDYRLAIMALENGADKVRVNPGNIGGPENLLAVAMKAKERGAAIRIGVNSGSVPKDLIARYGSPTPEAIVEAAKRTLDFLEDHQATGIVLSLKSSSVPDTVRAYALMAKETKWPFHIGITEAGPGIPGIIKSTAGIASLLTIGIGDTVRVSLTGSCVEEVRTAQDILQAVGVSSFGPNVISCPTCGRTQVDLMPVAQEIARKVRGLKIPMTIAVMGCPVNGPGEAREADVGIACGRDGGILFSHGKVVGSVRSGDMVSALMNLIHEEIQRRKT